MQREETLSSDYEKSKYHSSLVIPDEDRKAVRSDVGKKLTYSTEQQRTTAKNKKTDLLKDADLKRWHDNLARGSKITADVRLRSASPNISYIERITGEADANTEKSEDFVVSMYDTQHI